MGLDEMVAAVKLQIKTIDGKLLVQAEAESIRDLLIGAVKASADLRGADLRGADLRGTNLSEANLSEADLSEADLSVANLSGAIGIKQLDSLEWMRKNFRSCKHGVIVYKSFGLYNAPPAGWEVAPGAVLTEVCDPCPTDECGCGINFATREWIERTAAEKAYKSVDIWKCLIRWSWLPGVVIPWNTDGKARCCKLQLLEVVK